MSNNILLAHPGTQYSHQLARQLYRHGLLYQFWTGLAFARDSWSTRLLQTGLPLAWYKLIANRLISGVPNQHLRTMPMLECGALLQLRRGGSPQAVLHHRNQLFQDRLPESTVKKASALIGFDTSSWILVERALASSKPFILDQSAAHPLFNQAALEEVARCFPDWEATREPRLPEVLACENKEHKLATKIVVASSHTKRTLVAQGVPEEKIVVNPYGVDLELFHPPAEPRLRRPLRFLFLGSVSAHKGVPLLLEAWRSLAPKECELWLVGPVGPKERALIPELPGLEVKGKYPFEDLPAILRSCDVLVFPSYSDGFGLVLLEALASGMPIITTEATAGPDLITEKREGLLIPSGNLEALREAISYFVSQPEKLEEMSLAARACAEQFSWDSYGDRWQRILEDVA